MRTAPGSSRADADGRGGRVPSTRAAGRCGTGPGASGDYVPLLG